MILFYSFYLIIKGFPFCAVLFALKSRALVQPFYKSLSIYLPIKVCIYGTVMLTLTYEQYSTFTLHNKLNSEDLGRKLDFDVLVVRSFLFYAIHFLV